MTGRAGLPPAPWVAASTLQQSDYEAPLCEHLECILTRPPPPLSLSFQVRYNNTKDRTAGRDLPKPIFSGCLRREES